MDIEKVMMARSLLEEIDRLKELSSFFEVSDIRQVKVTIAHVEGEKPIMACRIYDSTGDKGYTDMCNLLDYITKGYIETIDNLKEKLESL